MAVQLGELPARLAACLDSLEGGRLPEGGSKSSSASKQYASECCALLQQTADHACAFDFVRQDVVKLLHHRLEHGESLAKNLLSQHLGTYLLQPQALQLLLASLPSAPSKQELLYKGLCRLLRPGVKECRWTSEQAQAASLRVVRERAMWELSKLVKTKADKSQGSTGELAAHLPWLLHLLLLTEAGAAPASAEETSGRSAEVVHEASENLSATTVHLVASSQPSRLASDHQSRKQEDHSTSVASSHVSDEKTPGKSRDQKAAQSPAHVDGLAASAAAVVRQLCSGASLCTWLGFQTDGLLTYFRQTLKRRPDSPRQLDTPEAAAPRAKQQDLAGISLKATLAAGVAEVCMAAVMQPDQAAPELLEALSHSTSAPETAESLCMDLAAVHATLLQIAEDICKQQQRLKGSERPCSKEASALLLSQQHLQPEALLRIVTHAEAMMLRTGASGGLHRTPRPSRSGERAQGVPVEVASHLMKLLEATLAAEWATAKDAEQASSTDLLSKALRTSMGLYRSSLAGPAPDLDYSLASPACKEVKQAFRQSRLAEFELAAPYSPSAQGSRRARQPAKSLSGQDTSSGGLKDNVHIAKKRRIEAHPMSSSLPQPELLLASAAAVCPLSAALQDNTCRQDGSSAGNAPEPLQSLDSSSEEGSGSDRESPLLQRGQFTDAQAERWWEHYIAVKLDLVQNVLQDDVDDGSGDAGAARSPPRPATGASPAGNPPGSAAAGLSSQKHGSKQSMMRDAGFREAPWQRLHVVSLNLMRQAVRMAHRQRVGASSACDDRDAGFQAASNGCIDLTSDSHKSSDSGPEALTQMLRELLPEQEVLAGIRNACLLIDPSCGSASYHAAITGAKLAPLAAIPVLLAVRMGRYLSGPGAAPIRGLIPAYLDLLEELTHHQEDDEEPESGQSRESGRSTCPRQVLSQLLLSFLDAGEMAFGRLPHDASSAGRLIRLILHGMPGAESACMASSGAIGLCQGMLGLCRKEPAWTSSLGAVLHSICFDVAESADVATCVALLQQLLHHGRRSGPSADLRIDSAEDFEVAADAVIAACRGVVCWEGLEVSGLVQTLGFVLDIAVAVHSKCATSTEALLDMLGKGGEASEETREHCQVAAFGPWLAESLKCFHQWIDAKLARQLHSKVKRLEDALVAELCPGDDGQAVTSKTGLLLQQLEACALAEGECSSAHPLQEQVREWYVQAFAQIQAGTTGAIALADEADAAEATTPDEATPQTQPNSQTKQAKAKREKKATRSSNPFVLAAMAELASHGGNGFKKPSVPGGDDRADDASSDDDSGDDLDDFIVCKPGRNYQSLFARQFKYSCAEPKSFLKRIL